MINVPYKVEGFLKIYDPNSLEVFVDKKNAINYENMSVSLADTLSIITYLPPNTTGQNAALYNETYVKIVDDTSVLNLDPTRNKMTVNHTSGQLYSDILVQCLLDYGEPAGQDAFDNSTQTDSDYIFDELGLLAYYGTDSAGETITRLLTHVIFHPVQKSLNRQIQIDYTVRIQALTNLITI
jgi:hypothetical protein